MDKLDKFIEDSKEMIGKEVKESFIVNPVVDRAAILKFARAILGHYNPLLMDSEYATRSKYGALVAMQTFPLAHRYAGAEGAYSREDYGLAKFFTGAEFQFYDSLRCGDSLTSELRLVDIYEKPYLGRPRAAHLAAEGLYWNQYKSLVCKLRSTVSMIPFERGKEMLIDRDIYEYSQNDVARISKDVEASLAAKPRGMATLYWDDVKVGEKLVPTVKGPVSLGVMHAWRGAAIKENYSEEIVYKRALAEPGNMRTNPTTNWPYWHMDQTSEDLFSCAVNGMPQPWLLGDFRVCLAEEPLVKWMGDDGFISKLNVELYKPFIYGDFNWYGGQVVDKYKERLNGETYNAVDIKLEITNQLGEKTGAGEATIYLPALGREVKLPITP